MATYEEGDHPFSDGVKQAFLHFFAYLLAIMARYSSCS
jgi:hypothetical protein